MLAALLDLSGFPFCEKRDNRRWNKWKQGKNVLTVIFYSTKLNIENLIQMRNRYSEGKSR